MSEPIDISKLSKPEVLAALYNNSRVQGMGRLQAKPGIMTAHEAESLLKEGTYFDYLYGKVMKVDLSKDTLAPWLYDRDNGAGAAARALSGLAEVVSA